MERGPVRVEFPAWELEDGTPFVCYVTPTSLNEADEMRNAVNKGVDDGHDRGLEWVLQTVIHRAKNEDGSRIFSKLDALELRQQRVDELAELAEKITQAAAMPVEEILGNSRTPSSSSD